MPWWGRRDAVLEGRSTEGQVGAERGAAQQREAILQPLTALVARVEVVRELAKRGEWSELIGQLAAVRASAERLATEAEAVRELPDGGSLRRS